MKKGVNLALYRKYRPKSLDDIVGQPQVTDILKSALKKQMISHAYLFSGPRGTGKTSAARILAHEFNNIEYSENLNLDIIEIDAASNRRIEDIRDLREVIKLAPTKLKYKIYIIDEVHMLTNESFNALLKTLEEPPEHAIFILATTDLHKVPATILSRTQKFNFRLLDNQKMAEHLKYIADSEKIKIVPDALSLIANLSGGSVRDAISILDQLHALSDDITADFVRDVMGMPSAKLEGDTMSALANFDSGSLLTLVDKMLDSGSDSREIIKNLISLTSRLDNITNLHLNLIDDLSSALSSYSNDLFLKIALIKFNPQIPQVELRPKEAVEAKTKSSDDANHNLRVKSNNKNSSDSKRSSNPDPYGLDPEPDQPKEVPPVKNHKKANLESSSQESEFKFSEVSWVKVLEEVKSKSVSTYAALRLVRPESKNETLTLTFKFDFHKKKLDEAKNKKILVEALKSVFNIEPSLTYAIDKDVDLKKNDLDAGTEFSRNQSEANAQESILSKVNDIMGGGEVIEA
jgi:DNA polymerase-3 subunit gamma/tau